jgi:hypothetical protein
MLALTVFCGAEDASPKALIWLASVRSNLLVQQCIISITKMMINDVVEKMLPSSTLLSRNFKNYADNQNLTH